MMRITLVSRPMPFPFTPQAAIFDWDGVVVDTFPIYHYYLQALCAHFGKTYPYRDLAHYRQNYEEPFVNMYGKCGFDWGFERPEIAKFYESFMAAQEITIFPEMAMMIKALERDSSFKLAIASSNSRTVVEDHLARFDLEDEFLTVMSAFTEKLPPKPAPDTLLRTAMILQVEPAETIYIGDQLSDIKAARAAGMKAGLVAWGYSKDEQLPNLGADYIFHTPYEIYHLLVGAAKEKVPSLF